MEKPIRLLMLEDARADAELVVRELRKGGIRFDVRRVETEDAFIENLNEFKPDIVLADYNLPSFDGRAAISIVKQNYPDLPILLVSGTVGEDIAVEMLKHGAWDYIMKERLFRLVPSVRRALKEADDTRERKRLQEALWTSAREWRATFDAVSYPVALLDGERKIRRCNKAMAALLGKPFDEVIGRNCCEIIHGTTGPIEGCPTIRMKETLHRETLLFPKGDRWFNIVVDPLFEENGQLVGAVHVMVDLTERKLSEETLRKSEEEFRELYDHAPVGYHEYDMEGRITRVNRTDLEMLGYTREEMIGQPVWGFNVDEEIARQQVLEKLAGLRPPARNLERSYRRKDGTLLTVLIEDRFIRDENGRMIGIRCTIQDITDRKKAAEEKAALEEQLRQSQKMEAIGRLAGGIAHDFNNLLTVISGYSQLSLGEIREEGSLRENTKEIQMAAQRAADLTRQLLAFSRRQVMEMKVLDLNVLVKNLDKILRRVLGEDIELATLLAADLGRVKADPGQIEQVIMNIAVNARDAMPSGGKLTIETTNAELDGEYARAHVNVTPGRYVMLSVSDTGVGMSSEVKERAFEPFFTTKGKEKGTGLGLSTAYGIVKQSGGNIWIYSEPGQGTTFKIYLPRMDEPLEEPAERATCAELPRGSETILVVEDEEKVRELAVRFLERQGYKVLGAPCGADTVTLCEQYGGPIHLILTDVVMPGMSGRELVQRLASVRPGIKVLYMSGYTDNAIVHHGVLEPGKDYIQKPFTMDGLARKVRDVLDK